MDDWQKVIAFHGHACCILAIGYRAAKLALSLIRETSDEGEQPVALVETVDCSTDAVISIPSGILAALHRHALG